MPAPLVGRDAELAALRRWLTDLDSQRGRLVLLTGEPGIGKTRLAGELVALALADGRRVAWGRAAEEADAPPLWPWREIVRGLGATIGDPPVVDGRPDDRFRIADEVATTVLAAAGLRGLNAVPGDGPGAGVVVVLDDAHCADRLSLLVLRHLVDRVARAPVLLVITYRTTGAPSALQEMIPGLVRSLGTERLDLSPLDDEGVRAQLRASATEVDSALVAAVQAATRGNPFFVDQVARALREGTWRPGDVPASVLDVVRSRLAPLTPRVRDVLGYAAIAGREFDLQLVADASDLAPLEVVTALDDAVTHGFVEATGDPGRYRFVHALTRDAVVAGLQTSDRHARSRRVAEVIEARYGEDPGDHLGVLARLWLGLSGSGGGAADQARRWSARAAADALRHTAFEDAARFYRSALGVPGPVREAERCELLVGLGRASFLAGDLAAATEAAQMAGAAARASGDESLVAEAAFILEAGTDLTLTAVARQLCEDALAALGPSGPAGTRARLLALRSHVALYERDIELTRVLSREALELARASGDDAALVEALRARQEASPGPSGREERLALADEMLAVATRTERGRTAMWGRLWKLDALVERGDIDGAEAELFPLRLAVDQAGGPVSAWLFDRCSASVAQARADFASASVAARRGFERMCSIEPQAAHGAYLALRCAVSHHVGPSDESVTLARQPFDVPPWFVTMGRTGRAFIFARARLLDEALVELRHAGPVESWRFPPFGVVSCLTIGALTVAALERSDDLRTLLERLAAYRGEHVTTGAGVVNYLGPVALHLGVGSLALGRSAAAVTDLRAALEASRRAGAPGFTAEAAHHLAVALLAQGSPDDGAEVVALADESGTLIDALGLEALAGASAALRQRVGAAFSGAAGLSAREQQVAALVAEGLSNRSIAERLVISERTASNHVQRILTKLEFNSRSQIAAWVVGRR